MRIAKEGLGADRPEGYKVDCAKLREVKADLATWHKELPEV